MIVTLTPGFIFGGIAALTPLAGAFFLGLRYVIRAETSELRGNSGSTMKDKVEKIERHAVRTEEMATWAAAKAEDAARTAIKTEIKLDDHVDQAKEDKKRGSEIEHDLRDLLGKQQQSIADLSHAVDIAAQSTPPA